MMNKIIISDDKFKVLAELFPNMKIVELMELLNKGVK